MSHGPPGRELGRRPRWLPPRAPADKGAPPPPHVPHLGLRAALGEDAARARGRDRSAGTSHPGGVAHTSSGASLPSQVEAGAIRASPRPARPPPSIGCRGGTWAAAPPAARQVPPPGAPSHRDPASEPVERGGVPPSQHTPILGLIFPFLDSQDLENSF